MNIRRFDPIAWNTGAAWAPMTTPHISSPSYHGERELQTQMRFVRATGFGNATDPENGRHEYGSRTEMPVRTRGMQDGNWIVQTLEFGFRKILKILRIVVWEQIFEGRDQSDDGNLGPLVLQDRNCCIYKQLEVRCDYDVLAPRLVEEVGDAGGRIPGRNCEGGTFRADDSELKGGIRDRV